LLRLQQQALQVTRVATQGQPHGPTARSQGGEDLLFFTPSALHGTFLSPGVVETFAHGEFYLEGCILAEANSYGSS